MALNEGLLAEASRARRLFEDGNLPRDLLARLYTAYNPNVEVNNFLDQAAQLFPSLNCGLATVYLQHKVGGDIQNGSYGDHNHTFLKLGGRILDITADQFGGVPIYVGELKAPWSVERSVVA